MPFVLHSMPVSCDLGNGVSSFMIRPGQGKWSYILHRNCFAHKIVLDDTAFVPQQVVPECESQCRDCESCGEDLL